MDRGDDLPEAGARKGSREEFTTDPLDIPVVVQEDDVEPIKSPNSVLENFRKEWKEELTHKKANVEPTTSSRETIDESPAEQQQQQSGGSNTIVIVSNAEDEDKLEDKARELFLRGVSLEKLGQYYDACKFYKQAFQLVPDIEKKVSLDHHHNPVEPENDPEPEEATGDLRSEFLNYIVENGWFVRDRMDNNSTHLNDFPEEVLSYIASWIVGRDLDVRSLDILSNTSKGFYVICRDEGLWKAICSKIWGAERRLAAGFSSYRQMYLTRSHVRFDGCYISKITYVRSGENSFQDQTYRPWYLIDYYRYIRFFTNGACLFLTTSEPPKDFNFITLRDSTPKSKKILQGNYKLSGQTITAQFISTKSHENKKKTKSTMEYNMEFTISDSKKKANWILNWNSYNIAVHTGTSSVSNEFDVDQHNKFPNLVFSRVKCFTKNSEFGLY